MASRNSNTGSSVQTGKLLIDSGADVNIQDNNEWTVLHMASKYSNTDSSLETVKLLLEPQLKEYHYIGSDIKYSTNEVHYNGQLITSSKDFNILMQLCLMTKEYPELLVVIKDMLINYKNIINHQNNKKWTALHMAARHSSKESSLETVKLLIDSGADVNIQTHGGLTALHVAAIFSNKESSLETVKLLIDSGADVNIQETDGLTALHLAARNINNSSSLETVKLLIDSRADVNIQGTNGWTALHFASIYSNTTSSLETVKLLIDSGADVNIQDKDGLTALHLAARYINNSSSLETVKLLIDSGTDIYIISNDGYTLLDMAPKIYLQNIIRYHTEYKEKQQHIKTHKKLTYTFVLSNMTENKNEIIFAPNHIGQIITMAKYNDNSYNEIQEKYPYILWLLDIKSKDDMITKFNQYKEIHCLLKN